MTSMTARETWRPMDASDAAWHGIETVRMFLGIDMPPLHRVRDAMRGLATTTAIGSWHDGARPATRPVQPHELDGWLDRTVIVVDEHVEDVERAVAMQGTPLDDLPLRVMVGPTWITVRQTHAVGDGWSSIHLLGHLLRQAGDRGAVDVPWTSIGRGRRAMLTTRLLARHPVGVLRATVRRKQLGGGPYELASIETAGLRPTVIHRRSAVGFSNVLRALRDEHFAGSSVAAMTLVGLRSALGTELPAPRPGTECVFDNRRESRASRRAFGNWSAGVYLSSADDSSPVAVSEAMAAARRSALPVMSGAAGRARARRGLSASRMVAVAAGAPRLTLSFTQGHGPLATFPGIDDARSTIALATTPNGPETITLTVADLRGTLHVSVSFYPDVWERAAVERAVDGFLRHPAGHVLPVRRVLGMQP